MKDRRKTKEDFGELSRTELVNELAELRQRVAELEVADTERQRAEERIQHLNLVLRAIRSVNQLITRERDRDRLLHGACERLIETRGYHNAWIALLDESRGLVTTAEAGLGEQFLPLVERVKRGELTACGRRALAQPGVVATEDPPSACAGCPLSKNYGGRGAMAIRLEHEGKVYGLLSASIPRGRVTSGEEQALFREVARDIAFALHGIELEEERTRAEEALRESEQRFRDVARTTGDWIWEVDAEGRYTYASPVVEQVLGYTPEDVLGKHYYDFFHPDDRETLKTLAQETFRKKESFVRLVNPNVHKDGRTVVLETSGLPLTDAEGNLLGYRGADRDVTARVWTEQTLRALNAAAAAVQRAARTPAAVFTAVMEQLRALGLTGAVVLLDEAREQFTIRYTALASQALLARAEKLTGHEAIGYAFPVEQLPIGRQVLAGETVFVPNVAALLAPVVPAPVRPLMPKVLRLLNMPRGVVAPLSIEGEIIGFLGVSAARMTEADIPAVTAFANQMAAALESTRLFEAEWRRQQELEALREISLAITAQLELDALLQNIVEQGCRLLDVGAGGVYLVDETRGDLELVVSHGYTRDYAGVRLSPDEGMAGRVLQSGEPLAVDDYQHWEGRSPDWKAESITGCLGMPLKRGEQVIGILEFAEVTQARSFGEHDLWLATLFASQATIAIQNARLYNETRSRAERLAVVNRVAEAVGTILDLDDLMETVYQEIGPIFQADAFFIALYNREANELDYRLRVDEGLREPRERRPLGTGLTSLVVSEKKPILIRDFEKEKDNLPEVSLWGTMKLSASWLGVPMLIGEQVTGVICVQTYRPHAYGEEEELLLSTIADQVAVALENARLYEQAQQEIAERKRAEEELQQSLEQVRKSFEGTIEVLVSTIGVRDPYTARHQRQVTRLACTIASEMGLPEEQIEGLHMAGLVHDIGKINVPAEILSKPGTLSDLEYGLIRMHVQTGYDVLKTVEFPWPVAQIVLQHHERMDGSGYPQGLSDDEIMLEARILAVADVVTAMASHRPYRPACGLDEALEEISQNKGVLYDAEVVDACLRLFAEKGFEFE